MASRVSGAQRGAGMNLFIFGVGFSVEAYLRAHIGDWARVTGTVRSCEKAARLRNDIPGLETLVFDGVRDDPAIELRLSTADALLVSVPPRGGDLHVQPCDLATRLRLILAAFGATRQSALPSTQLLGFRSQRLWVCVALAVRTGGKCFYADIDAKHIPHLGRLWR